MDKPNELAQTIHPNLLYNKLFFSSNELVALNYVRTLITSHVPKFNEKYINTHFGFSCSLSLNPVVNISSIIESIRIDIDLLRLVDIYTTYLDNLIFNQPNDEIERNLVDRLMFYSGFNARVLFDKGPKSKLSNFTIADTADSMNQFIGNCIFVCAHELFHLDQMKDKELFQYLYNNFISEEAHPYYSAPSIWGVDHMAILKKLKHDEQINSFTPFINLKQKPKQWFSELGCHFNGIALLILISFKIGLKLYDVTSGLIGIISVQMILTIATSLFENEGKINRTVTKEIIDSTESYIAFCGILWSIINTRIGTEEVEARAFSMLQSISVKSIDTCSNILRLIQTEITNGENKMCSSFSDIKRISENWGYIYERTSFMYWNSNGLI